MKVRDFLREKKVNIQNTLVPFFRGFTYFLEPLKGLQTDALKEDSQRKPEESCKVETLGTIFVLRHVLLVYIMFEKNLNQRLKTRTFHINLNF